MVSGAQRIERMPCITMDFARLSFSSMLTSMKASAFFSLTTSSSTVRLMNSSESSLRSWRRTSTLTNVWPSPASNPIAARDAPVCSSTRSVMKPNS